MSKRSDNIRSMCSYLSLVQRWCTANELALRLRTSTRTIRSYVQLVNSIGENPPILSSPAGYLWSKNASAPPANSNSNRSLQTPRERLRVELKMLLYYGATDIYEAAQDLAISNYTFQNDMSHIRELCKRFNLSVSIRRDTVSIKGNEARKRILCHYAILDGTGKEPLSYDFIVQAFPEHDINQLRMALDGTLFSCGLVADTFDFLELLLFCAIQQSRIHAGHLIDCKTPTNAPSSSPAWMAVRKFERLRCANGQQPYTTFEREYLAMLFYSFSRADLELEQSKLTDSHLISDVNRSIEFLCNNVELSTEREQLAIDIASWTSHMFVRQRNLLPTCKPTYLQLRNSHVTSFDLAVWILSDLVECYAVKLRHPEIEASSLAAIIIRHVKSYTWIPPKPQARLICPTSQEHAQEIASYLIGRTNNQFDFKCVTAFVESINWTRPVDFTVSILPIKQNTPTAIISPFPTESDVVAIADVCAASISQRNARLLGLYFKHYLIDELYSRNMQLRTKGEVLNHLCNMLEKHGRVLPRFRSQILRRENIDDTSFHGFVALPHACTSSVKHNTIAVYQSDVPIDWGSQTVNLIILIAIEHGLLQDFYAIYEGCIRFLSNPAHIAGLLSSSSATEFIHHVGKAEGDT